MKQLILAAVLATAFTAQAQEVKGLKLGMTKAEVAALFPSGTRGMTIAGAQPKYQSSEHVRYEDDKLVSVLFFFNAKDFDTVRDAFKTKYPDMQCTDSTVTNRMGAEFTDTKCRYQSLRLDRFVSDINTAAVGLTDPEFIARQANERKAKAASDL